MNQRSRSSTPADRPLAAIVLAAGKGTRMNSDLPKVVHEVAGRPMVSWVVDAIRDVGAKPIVLIIGHGADEVRTVFEGDDDDIIFTIQDEQLGTGHATHCAREPLYGYEGDVLLLAGDGPLIRPKTIRAMHERHVSTGAAATLATSCVEDPTGYGRIIRDNAGRFHDIVEERNATDPQRRIKEIYPSYACFDYQALIETLDRLGPDPRSGEYYVTAVPAMMREAGLRVELIDAVPPEDVLSINTPEQLAEVETILLRRVSAASAASAGDRSA